MNDQTGTHDMDDPDHLDECEYCAEKSRALWAEWFPAKNDPSGAS